MSGPTCPEHLRVRRFGVARLLSVALEIVVPAVDAMLVLRYRGM